MLNAIILAAQIAGAAAAQAVSAGCSNAEISAIAEAEAMMNRGDDPRATTAGMFAGTVAGKRCDAVLLVRGALTGWDEARQLAAVGGDRARLAPVLAKIDALEPLKGGPLRIEVEYAQVAIRAAMAASQDERPELELLLTHGRDLAERVARRGGRMIWPRPINLLAGELWLEVDRYDEAHQAFLRAVSVDPTPRALVGLSEALLKLERRAEACETLTRVKNASGPLLVAVERLRAACQ
jgi:tetratricopeptide (TPR) repeat protein